MSSDGFLRPLHGPWEGGNKIVIGIDIGTTQSGIAFTFLQKGQNMDIHRVARWPGQETHNQQSKIPTLVWYDVNSEAVAFGAEALLPSTEEEAEDNGWTLAKNFKLHLHPIEVRSMHQLKLDRNGTALPPGVSLRQVYSDFLGYLLQHTRVYFEDRILDGRQIWERYSPTMEVVIAHPNGWGIREQVFLRSAAVAAGLSTADRAPAKVRFVTEAEASVYFCIHHTNLGNVIQPGINFAVCDAGGSTVDTTLYSVVSTRPSLELMEKRASACVQAGALFVDLEAEKFLQRILKDAGLPFDEVSDFIRAGVKDFEIYVKRAFKDETHEHSIALAHLRFNNPALRVRRGRMTISGSTIKEFFDVCVREILSSVDGQLGGLNVSHILLVGGFGDSPYLRQEFRRRYEPRGCQVTSTNDSTSKAVADGAVLWTVANSLSASSRIPLLSWGIETSVIFDPNNPDHAQRKEMSSTSYWTTIPGRWEILVKKGIVLDNKHVVKIPYSLDFPSPSAELGTFVLDLYSYSGNDEPLWMRNKKGTLLPNFRKDAIIRTELESLRESLESRLALGGTLQWKLDFDICVGFGDTELKAYLECKDKGDARTYPCACTPVSGET